MPDVVFVIVQFRPTHDGVFHTTAVYGSATGAHVRPFAEYSAVLLIAVLMITHVVDPHPGCLLTLVLGGAKAVFHVAP